MAVEGVPGSLPRSQPRPLRRCSESSCGSAPQSQLDRSLRVPRVCTAVTTVATRSRNPTHFPGRPPGRPTRLLGRYRNVCCDGSPGVDWFAPAIATLATPATVAEVPLFRHRMHPRIVSRMRSQSPPRPQRQPLGAVTGRTPWSPQKRAARLLGPYRSVCRDDGGRGARFAPSTATSATRRAVGKDSPVRYRMRRGG